MPLKPKLMDSTNDVRHFESEPCPLAQHDEAVLPLVYSCSGASSAAQMANHLAVRLDRLRVADMSCIAGLGGDVGPLLRTAKSGRPILAIDGCPLRCVLRTLKRHELVADRYYDLADFGVAKRPHEDFSPGKAEAVLEHVLSDLEEMALNARRGTTPGDGPADPFRHLETAVGGAIGT
jgi:uncharacterized metal-binding protein